MYNKTCAIILVTTLVFLAGLGKTKEGEAMEIKSPEFNDGQFIPSKFSCEGKDINPELTIEGIPERTRSLALILEDPDALTGTWVHWIIFDIPPTAKIGENSVPGKQGINSAGGRRYHGPCPPSGTHRYFFKLYALDAVLNLNPGISREQLEKAMPGHILASAQLLGLYKKNR